MKILNFGAAGQISRILTKKILDETDYSIVLFARNGSKRLEITDPDRVTIIDGDYKDKVLVKQALEGVDVVYLNDLNDPEGVKNVVQAMEECGVKKLIVASVLDIYREVPGEFGKWNERMVGRPAIALQRELADFIEDADVEHTILRLTWLYNQADNENYQLTQKGEPFEGAQVTREAVVRLILDSIENPEEFSNKSIGVSEPNTNWEKPSFY